ncbi:MAG: hypothetical protein N2512_02490 [Armatimonadetes bacterium]|nr:hypothetical protein [Armatimonadota bacterium]
MVSWRQVAQWVSSVLGAGLFVNGLSEVFGLRSPWMSVVAGVALLGLGFLAWWRERARLRRLAWAGELKVAFGKPLERGRFKYLVMAPSTPDVARFVLAYLKDSLLRVWLLVSEENPPYWTSRRDLAEELEKEVEGWVREQGPPRADIITVTGPFEAAETKRVVAGVLRSLSPEERKFAVVDLTGGTAMMTVGMAAAVMEVDGLGECSLSYAPAVFQPSGDGRLKPTTPQALVAVELGEE